MMTTTSAMVAKCSWTLEPRLSQDAHCRKQWRIKLVRRTRNMGSRVDMLDTCGSGNPGLVGEIRTAIPFETRANANNIYTHSQSGPGLCNSKALMRSFIASWPRQRSRSFEIVFGTSQYRHLFNTFIFSTAWSA
jgi:hypothetical protein